MSRSACEAHLTLFRGILDLRCAAETGDVARWRQPSQALRAFLRQPTMEGERTFYAEALDALGEHPDLPAADTWIDRCALW